MPSTTETESRNKLSKEEISKYLKKYDQKNIDDINLGTHVRYFSALRTKDSNHDYILRSNGKPKITFKRGGFLKLKNREKGYIMLSNQPIQQTNNTKKPIIWSVPLDQYTTLFAIKPPMKVKDEIMMLKEEIKSLKSQINKLKKKNRN